MPVDGGENGPQREINMIGALDVHRHAHGRGMSDERMRRVVGGHEDAGANRLLSQIIVQNLLLDALHYMTSKVANHSQIHAGIHQTKRIASGDNTIKRWQILETATNNLNFWVRAKLPAKNIAELLASIYQNESHLVALVS